MAADCLVYRDLSSPAVFVVFTQGPPTAGVDAVVAFQRRPSGIALGWPAPSRDGNRGHNRLFRFRTRGLGKLRIKLALAIRDEGARRLPGEVLRSGLAERRTKVVLRRQAYSPIRSFLKPNAVILNSIQPLVKRLILRVF